MWRPLQIGGGLQEVRGSGRRAPLIPLAWPATAGGRRRSSGHPPTRLLRAALQSGHLHAANKLTRCSKQAAERCSQREKPHVSTVAAAATSATAIGCWPGCRIAARRAAHWVCVSAWRSTCHRGFHSAGLGSVDDRVTTSNWTLYTPLRRSSGRSTQSLRKRACGRFTQSCSAPQARTGASLNGFASRATPAPPSKSALPCTPLPPLVPPTACRAIGHAASVCRLHSLMAAPETAQPPAEVVEAVKQRMEGTWSRGAAGYHKVQRGGGGPLHPLLHPWLACCCLQGTLRQPPGACRLAP